MVNVVARKTNPFVDSLDLFSIFEHLLTGDWIGVKSSIIVEALKELFFGFDGFLRGFSLRFLSLDESIQSDISLLLVDHLVLGIQDLKIMLFFLGHGKFFEVIIWHGNVVIGHDPGVWSIYHGAVWE